MHGVHFPDEVRPKASFTMRQPCVDDVLSISLSRVRGALGEWIRLSQFQTLAFCVFFWAWWGTRRGHDSSHGRFIPGMIGVERSGTNCSG